MKQLHIVGVGGSMNPNSQNLRALRYVMQSISQADIKTTLINVRDLDLPMYDDARDLASYPAHIQDYIVTIQNADGIIWSTSAYHGTIAGISKNAIDYLQYLDGGDYLDGKAIGVLATAGGTTAATNAANALVHSAHSLRGTVVPLILPIPQAWDIIEDDGSINDGKWAERMQKLGMMTVALAKQLQKLS
ncbi:MAG: NADPH-dependent FMN reductase [Aggregatilineales bacterium]